MKMQFELILMLSLLVPNLYGEIVKSTEIAPVFTKGFADFGYACESANPNLGALNEGEVRRRYEHYICGQATCNNGTIFYETCGTIAKENDCLPRYVHYYQSYPDCCTPVNCD